MKRLCKVFALGLALCTGAAAQAGPLDWSYKWNVSPIAVQADQGGNISMTNLTAGIKFGSSDVIATNLRTNSDVTDGVESFNNPAEFPNNYTLTMTLTQTDTLATETFTFDGHFEGVVSSISSDIDNFFDSPTSITKTLNGIEYTVEIGPYVAPPSQEDIGSGSIGAHVTVTPKDDDPPPPNDVPEPSTLLLSGLGLSVLGLMQRRKKA